jgi:DNA/RNA-binding domain of Phe-tRNA-synthetase-like protein
MDLSVAQELQTIVTAGVLAFEDVRVVERDAPLGAAFAHIAQVVRAAEARAEVTSAVRAMYRRVGLDPTKTRPSSEALLRRLRRGEPLPRVNSAVDVCNWCSVETQVPFGLYDLDRVHEPIELRVGREGEEYAGIRKDIVHVAGRMTLADSQGPFGNPTSDSARTMVTPATVRLLVVAFTPASAGRALAEQVMAVTVERMQRFTGGRLASGFIRPGGPDAAARMRT